MGCLKLCRSESNVCAKALLSSCALAIADLARENGFGDVLRNLATAKRV